MGFLFSKIIELFSRSKNNFKILILGIQNAGKTTILYRLSIGQHIKTSPTIGSNCEEIAFNNLKFQAWDLGGQESIRGVWDVYYLNTDGIIYVIDSNDADNFDESKTQFYKVLENDSLKNVPVLVFANKQDLTTAKKLDEIMQVYGLDMLKTHKWHLQPCSAETGEGLINGMQWLSDQLVFQSSNSFPNNPYKESNELDKSENKLKTNESSVNNTIASGDISKINKQLETKNDPIAKINNEQIQESNINNNNNAKNGNEDVNVNKDETKEENIQT